MSAHQVSCADLETALYANVIMKLIWNKLDCVEKYLCVGDQKKAYYHLIPEIRTSAGLKKCLRPLPSAAFYSDILRPILGKSK